MSHELCMFGSYFGPSKVKHHLTFQCLGIDQKVISYTIHLQTGSPYQ